MTKLVACLGVAAAVLGAAALPGAAAAADLYGYGGDDRPSMSRGWGDAPVERRDDLRPLHGGGRRGPGPVVFDERGPEWRGGEGYGEPAPRRGYGYGRPAAFVPRLDPPGFGAVDGDRPAAAYRPAAVYRPMAAYPEGPGFGDDGAPDVGCTVEQVRTTTLAGWRKTVTQRTCYRR